jgi:hypothetical protein
MAYNQDRMIIYPGCIPPVDPNVELQMPRDGSMVEWTGAQQRSVTKHTALRWRQKYDKYTGENIVYLIIGKRVQHYDGRLEDLFGQLLLSRSVC